MKGADAGQVTASVVNLALGFYLLSIGKSSGWISLIVGVATFWMLWFMAQGEA